MRRDVHCVCLWFVTGDPCTDRRAGCIAAGDVPPGC